MSVLLDFISHLVALLISAALSHFGLMGDRLPSAPEPVPVSTPAPESYPTSPSQ